MTEAIINDDSQAIYLREASQYDYLASQEEERDLALRWKNNGDKDALDKLVGSHLRLVGKIARDYRGYNFPPADLIGEGHVGLMEAAKRFDPDRGYRFATYAMWWIKATIKEHILRNWSLVRIGSTGDQKKLFFNLRRLKGKLQKADGVELTQDTVSTIAEKLQVSPDSVIQMNMRMTGGGDRSLNQVIGTTESTMEWQDLLVDDRPSQETTTIESQDFSRKMAWLNNGMKHLTAREQDILTSRRLVEPAITLEELGSRYGVSRERIRQIELRAFQKVQKAVLDDSKTSRPPAGHVTDQIAA